MGYQATAGQRLYFSTNFAMTTPVFVDGVTTTPEKGGEPDSINVNIMSERFARSLVGQQSMDAMTYEIVPDFASDANIAVIQGIMQANEEGWFFEEYETGTGTSDAPALGTGILYKGKIASFYAGGQSGNSAQTASFSVNFTGQGFYIARRSGGDVVYTDFDGNVVTTPT